MSVRHAVLGILTKGPCHGYELRAAFTALIGGEQNWDLKPAQVYTTLARLEKAGLVAEDSVEQEAGPEKRLFVITADGRRFLEEWFAEGVAPEPQRDEFFIKLMVGLISGIADPYEIIQTQRTHLYRDLHTITMQRTQADPARELAKILLMDKAAMHLEADLRWLDMTEARLQEVKRQPLPEPEMRPRGRPKKKSRIGILGGRNATHPDGKSN